MQIRFHEVSRRLALFLRCALRLFHHLRLCSTDGRLLNDERNKAVVALSLYYIDIFLTVLRKTTKNSGLGGRCFRPRLELGTL